jgi:hypothetical protein
MCSSQKARYDTTEDCLKSAMYHWKVNDTTLAGEAFWIALALSVKEFWRPYNVILRSHRAVKFWAYLIGRKVVNNGLQRKRFESIVRDFEMLVSLLFYVPNEFI